MKLVKEHINFERGGDPLKRMGVGQYEGRKPGQILISDTPLINNKAPLKRLYIFVQKEPTKHGMTFDTEVIHIGFITGNPAYAHFGIETPFMGKLWKQKETLRYPNEKEQKLIELALKKEQYQKYINRATEIIGTKPFV
jgi:hypothetical protein